MTRPIDEAFSRSIEDPEGFWGQAAEAIHWYKKWDKVLDDSNKPFYRWFKGGIVNTCYNAIDRHVEGGRADQLALIYDSPVTGNTIRTYTYRQLRDEVAKFAGVLVGLGVAKGDRVVIYMPMVPEAPISMLACARIGAVHSVVFGGFAANELAVRLNDAQPKVIVTASCGIEVGRVIDYKPLIESAIELAVPGFTPMAVSERVRRPAAIAVLKSRARTGPVVACASSNASRTCPRISASPSTSESSPAATRQRCRAVSSPVWT